MVDLLAYLMGLLTFSMFCVLIFTLSICINCLLLENAYEYLIVISLSKIIISKYIGVV